MVSKAHCPTFNEFMLAFKAHEVSIKSESKNFGQPNHEQTFYSQKGKSRGRGRYFSSRGKGFHHGRLSASTTQPLTFTQDKRTVGQYSKPPTTAIMDRAHYNTKSNQEIGVINSNLYKTNTIICQICGKGNHTALERWNHFDHSYQSEEIPKALAAINLNEGFGPLMYVDLGATSHMLNDPDKVFSLQPYRGLGKIFVGNGNQLEISHIGQGKIVTITMN